MSVLSVSEPARRRGALLSLFLVVFVSMTGFGVVIPIMPFFGLHLNASATAITLAIGAYSLGQFIAAPLWGRLSDRFGRRPILILTLAATALSYLVLAVIDQVWALGAVRFAAGLAAGNIGAGFAAAADLSTPQTRARAMGVVGAGFGLGFIVGPALGGLIAGPAPDQADFARVCFVAAAMAGAAAVAAFALLPETRPLNLPPRAPGAARALLRRPVFAALCAATLFGVAGQAALETTFGLWADATLGWGPPETGINLGLLGLLAAGLQGLGAGPLARRFGERRLLLAGYGLFLAGFVALAFAQGLFLAYLGVALLGAGAGLIGPSSQSLISQEAGEADRGAALGVQQSASALGRVAGPLFAGPAFDLLGAAGPFVAGGVVAAIALGLTAIALRRAA